MNIRKPINLTLPADEAAQLCAMLVGMERYYEERAVEDGLNEANARAGHALASTVAEKIMEA